MSEPSFEVDARRVRAYCEMFGIPLAAGEEEIVAGQLAAALPALAGLRAMDVEGHEPFPVFAVDRVTA